MAKYVLAYHGGEGMPETEEAQAEVMAAWGGWFESLGAAVVDGGAPFGPSATVSADGSSTPGGGKELTGYSVIEAGSLDDAIAKSRTCPVLSGGGTVEVYEAIEM